MLHGRAQIVSSLFSSNPNIPSVFKKSVYKGSDEASNAALVDSSTFTGIGLTADLSAHLANKLQVTAPTHVQAKAIPVLLGPSARVRQTAVDSNKADVDVVVQAQTGSGKTLTYLLPIVNRLIEASTAPKDSPTPPFGDRAVGTVAIILTPTRELAQQVLGVLTQLLNVPRPKDESLRRQHWIVPGIVIGGDSKAKEKARLRKGINMLVSTPGRLLDHLENTKSFDIRNLKWLVLDEADRLLDLGFEETLKKIMQLIDDRTRLGCLPNYRDRMANAFWPSKRQTVLCSATLRDDVKELAGWSLVNPAFISGTETKKDADEEMKFTTPNQLKQTYTIVPAKLRLITLLALIRSYFFDKKQRKSMNSKIIVFFSCCDSVDFHYDLFSSAGKPVLDEDDSDDELTAVLKTEKNKKKKAETEKMKKALDKVLGKKKFKPEKDNRPISQISTLLSEKPVFRLHGELNQQTRSDTFAEFTKATSGVLFCTDVAARGLDLPNVDRIIQYDVPTDLKDYVHRAGRTARIGRVGEATLFLLPSEMEYVDILKAQDLHLEQLTMETILKNIAESKDDYQTPAQHLQNTMESYTVSTEDRVLMARKAFWSTVRAYATHPATEKHIFHVKKLHLGHLAKSFALREAPSNIMENVKGKKATNKKERARPEKKTPGIRKPRNNNVPIKRGYDNASEFAIASASSMKDGPTTKKRKRT
ncbi:P-loop containing nucleoside triphosphate hydrolase protein [Sporodiniella umbellata]|nr:P-loop containing nucleoside triphosphate hydrolase protein [Sporodiniella umbellata]